MVEELDIIYNGDYTGKYFPARSQEFELAKLLLDERHKEGQVLGR